MLIWNMRASQNNLHESKKAENREVHDNEAEELNQRGFSV